MVRIGLSILWQALTPLLDLICVLQQDQKLTIEQGHDMRLLQGMVQ